MSREISRLRTVVEKAVEKTRQILKESERDATVAAAKASADSWSLRRRINELELEVVANKREAEAELVATKRKAEAELVAVRLRAEEESRTLNTKVRDLEAQLVLARMDQEGLLAYKQWLGVNRFAQM